MSSRCQLAQIESTRRSDIQTPEAAFRESNLSQDTLKTSSFSPSKLLQDKAAGEVPVLGELPEATILRLAVMFGTEDRKNFVREALFRSRKGGGGTFLEDHFLDPSTFATTNGAIPRRTIPEPHRRRLKEFAPPWARAPRRAHRRQTRQLLHRRVPCFRRRGDCLLFFSECCNKPCCIARHGSLG